MAEKFHVGHGHYNGAGVTVFPVWLETPAVQGHCWKPAHLRVGELEAGASVNNLAVTNNGQRPHIVLEGDIFEGGRQNRMLSHGQVIARGERREVAVACVEEGRWHGAGEHRGGARRATYGVRFGMSEAFVQEAAAGRNPQNTGVTQLAQNEVWNRIRRHENERGHVEGHSLMQSLTEMDSRRAPELSTATVLPGQRGVIIGIGGYIAAAEFFGSTSGLTARWEGILSAARYEAMAMPNLRTVGGMARDFAAILQRAPVGENLPTPVAMGSAQGPLAISSFALGFGLIHAAVFNGAHPAMAGI